MYNTGQGKITKTDAEEGYQGTDKPIWEKRILKELGLCRPAK